jgi:hypothetical protein
MARHIRQSCKIANSDEGMEKLMEHTLQHQLAEQRLATTQLQAQVAAQSAQMAELTTLLKGALTLSPQGAAPSTSTVTNRVERANQVNNGPVTNVTNNVTQINIRPWGGEDRIVIPAAMLRAAFTENAHLVEYCRLSDEERVDAERAAPYVTEALVDLVKRAHADPLARNVYLNPRRSDQVMVFDEATWRIVTLVEAIRALFDGVADNIHRIIVSDAERGQLPLDVQAAASWVPNLYEDEPEKYVAKAKPQMSAHLANTVPTLALGGQ